MKSDAGAEHVATLQTRKGLEALEPKCCGLCCTAGATLAGSRQKKVCLFLCSVEIFLVGQKGNSLTMSMQLAARYRSAKHHQTDPIQKAARRHRARRNIQQAAE
jgi:hypothetical protein